MDNEREIIELTGEEGDSIKCEYLDTVLVEDNEYVVLLPLDGEADGCDSCDCGDHECTYEVIIMKIDKNEGGEFLVPVEDDDELEKAFEVFMDQIDEEDDED